MSTSSLTSIWENDFYEKPPQPLYAFEVDFAQYTDLSENDQKTLAKAIKSCAIKERSLQLTNSFYGGMTFRHPARADMGGELSITFNENESMEVTTILHNLWNSQSCNELWSTTKGNDSIKFRNDLGDNKIILKPLQTQEFMAKRYGWTDDQKKKMTPYVYATDNNQQSKNIKYCHCILMNIGEIEFSYDSEDTAEIQATFSYNYMLVNQEDPTGVISDE